MGFNFHSSRRFLEESKPEPKKRGRPRKTPVKAKTEPPKLDFENFDPNEALSRIDDMTGNFYHFLTEL